MRLPAILLIVLVPRYQSSHVSRVLDAVFRLSSLPLADSIFKLILLLKLLSTSTSTLTPISLYTEIM